MTNPITIPVEAEYQRQELLRQAEQQRLAREFRQSKPRRAKRLTLNTLLSVIRPVEVERRPAPRVPVKSH